VVVRLPDDLPTREADVVISPRPTTPAPAEVAAEIDRFLAALPAAPVIPLRSLDRDELYWA
jgi:hypothetical protein